MITGPAASLQSISGQSLKMSLGGMLLCIFACTLMLLNVSRDRTGGETAEVRRAFEASLQTYGHPFDKAEDETLSPNTPALDTRATAQRSLATSGTPKFGVTESAAGRANSFDTRSDSATYDVGRAGFLSLLNELQRYCKMSRVDRYAGELAFDFLSLDNDAESHLVREASHTIRLIHAEKPAAAWDFEVIMWARSPGDEPLAEAVLKSCRIQQALLSTMTSRAADSSITSSGRVWLQSDDVRPVLTLVARRRFRSYPVAMGLSTP